MKCMLHLADFALYGFFWADWAAAAKLLVRTTQSTQKLTCRL